MGIQNILKTVPLESKNGRSTYKKPKPGEEVVITGMAGKFPNSDGVYQFRDNLYNKVDLVSNDNRRWKPIYSELPHRSGKLNDIHKFDIGFFGVSQLQSDAMCPMTRMGLEKVFEAMVDAGYHPSDFENTNTGVFVAASVSETEQHSYFCSPDRNSDALSGSQKSMFAKWISYFYKLNGPAFVADTACSSSLFALNHAYEHMMRGLCEKAIVCGGNLLLSPMLSMQFAKLGVLSPEGKCKSFDDSGDGYVRAEAVTCILLERSKDAKRIYAEVIHSKTNCDGYKEQGITFPSSNLQQELMKDFYDEVKIDPSTLTFVEAHGTGTLVGDPEEINTIDGIFCKGRDKPLLIGSVKSNIGHSEAAAGGCSIVKVLIGMESGFIPPNIHYNTPRKGAKALEEGRLVIVTEKTPWPENKALVGVNGFGFGGANAHVLLKWNPKVKTNDGVPEDNLPRLICISGRTSHAVQNIMNDVCGRKLDAEYVKLIHQVYRKLIPNHLFRGYSIITKEREIEREIVKCKSFQTKLCLVFTNNDEKWFQLGKDLMSIPIYAGSMKRIQDVLHEKLSMNIVSIFLSHNNENYINQVLGTVLVQLAIVDTLKDLNIRIDMTIGIGYGELLCGYVDDFLSFEQVILAAYYIASELGKESIDKNRLRKIIPKHEHRPYKWVPIYHGYQHNIYHTFGSIDYLINNISSPMALNDCKKYMKADDVSLIIGHCNVRNGDNWITLLDLEQKNTIIDLLESLGRVYLKGFAMELDKLYPKISLPVSRGTPMLSPLIEWDHTTNCAVREYKHEGEKLNGRSENISAKAEEWSFVTGHIIDGRNLFPATGYLILAGNKYASMLGEELINMCLVFENVKFLRAANVPPNGFLSLKVMIQSGSKYFEITENDSLLVSGKIYKCQNPIFTDLPSEEADKDEYTMEVKDVYKELKLRGYNYINQFRAIKKCNMAGTNAVISWTGNWITFMDNMLQIKILQVDTKNLYVPTSIQRLIIDGPRQKEYANQYQNDIPIVCHKKLPLISGGGVEIYGLGATSIPRKKHIEPVLETYKFIPYVAQLTEEDAVRCLVQIILENTNVIRVKAVEMGAEKLFMPLVQQTLADLPLIQPELIVLSQTQLDLPGINFENKQLSSESGCLLVLVRDIFEDNKLLEAALKATRDLSGYIISLETTNSLTSPPSNIKIIASYNIQIGTLLLLQEAKKSTVKKTIQITSSTESLSWVEPLKEMIKSNQKIVLYCQNSASEGLLGLVNCLRREVNGKNMSAVLLMDKAQQFDVNHEFYKEQLEKNVAINVWKDGKWGSYRHLLIPQTQMVESEHCYVNAITRGDLSSLKWIEGSLSQDTVVEQGSELVNIYYAAINFRDIMTASGRIQADVITRDRILQECIQGIEFSGTDSSGRRVMGMVASGALSTLIVADQHLLWPIPPQWSLEEAATVPVVYATVIYALLLRGGMKRGQSILIHSGSGGVGQAAINIAIHQGCTVFTTVGTPEKKEFIKRNFPQIKEEHIGDSRSTTFEQMVLNGTNGKGVDFVLNSLAEEKLQASVRCLARRGTFLEIGKFDLAIDNPIAVSLLEKEAVFQGIMLDRLFDASNDMKEIITRKVTDGICSGAIKPLVRTTFMADEIQAAFRYMASGKHIGKVLIKIRDEQNRTDIQNVPRSLFKALPRFSCKPNCSYVILGGLGGFGLELADWLVVRGAKKLVLTSRTGVKNGYQSFRLNIFKSYGATVIIRTDDVASPQGCQDLLKAANALGPVDGIFNLAVVLQDALFENQTEEAFRTALAPKATATKNLDAMSRTLCPDCRYFVVFSSVSCGRGNAGQTNYGMANSVMERVCEMRKKDGYPGLAIQWGAVGDVGIVADMQDNNVEIEIGGTLQQKISNCLQVLDRFLRQDETIVSSMVVAEKRASSGATNVVDAVLHILGVTNIKTISLHSTLPELGMDSIMAVELKQTLERDFDIFLAPQEMRDLTLAKLKEMAEKQNPDLNNNVVGENAEREDDINLLLRHIGDESTSLIPRVTLETLVSNEDFSTPHVIAFAGAEGQAVIFDSLAKKLKFRMTCLQFCANNHLDTIEDIALTLLDEFQKVESDEFLILGYSFGAVVAVEIAHLLEQRGKRGRMVFVDGAPDYLQEMIQKIIPYNDENIIQTMFLIAVMSRYIPYKTLQQHQEEILKCDGFVKKLEYCGTFATRSTAHSDEYLINCLQAGYARTRAVRCYKPKMKLEAKLMLATASLTSVSNISEDYGLSKIFTNQILVEKHEGNHLTILDSDALAESINNFIINN